MAEFKYLNEEGVVVIAGKIKNVASELSNLKTVVEENATADAVLAEVVNTKFDKVEYNKESKKIIFYGNNEEVDSIDASDFIKDGMIEEVKIEEGNLVITFNTDSGKEEIKLPLSNIFNAENYYTKEEINAELEKKQNAGDYAEYTPFTYKGEQRKSLVLNEGDTISSMGINFGTVKTYEGLQYDEAKSNSEFSGLMPVLEIGGQKGALVLNTCEDVVKVEVWDAKLQKRVQHSVATLDDINALPIYIPISVDDINAMFV